MSRKRGERVAGIVSIGDHYTEGNIHLVSSVIALDTFWDAPGADRVRNIVHIPTAADRFTEFGFENHFIKKERDWLADQLGMGALHAVQELSLKDASLREIEEALRGSDAVLVGGGNTQYLLEVMRRTEADRILKDLVQSRAVMYIGRSAGAMAAGPDIGMRGSFWLPLTHEPFEDTSALGLTDVYPIPHIDSELIMSRTHPENGYSGYKVAKKMAKRYPTVFLTDALDISSSEDV